MKKIIIIVAVLIIALIVIFTRGSGGTQEVSTLDAVDTVGEFYTQWLEAVREPSTADPSLETLASSPILSKELRARLEEAEKGSDADIDPVLCQSIIPEDIVIRNISGDEDEVRILVTSKDKKVTNQAVVILKSLNDGWYINDIECSLGEFAPEKEFSFESEGFLLKGSIPAPYDSKNWHLVFEEDGVAGHVVPLLFGSKSTCTSQSGSKSACSPAQFSEVMKVFVQGQLTELGVDVVKMEFVK